MNVDQDKLIEYILGHCPINESEMIKQKLSVDKDLQEEYAQLAKIWAEFDQAPLEQPSESLQERFDTWLNQETHKKQKRKTKLLSIYKYAAAIAVLAIAVTSIMMREQSREINLPAQDSLSNLVWASSSSTTERIKGIYQHTEDPANSPELVGLLIKLLQQDESPNVRLTALDALQTFSMSEEIKDGMITALENEEKPVVQIAIITALVGLQESDAKPQLEALINDLETESSVKDEAQLGLLRL